eukprot:10419923-Karenia_brevis.AAC.1
MSHDICTEQCALTNVRATLGPTGADVCRLRRRQFCAQNWESHAPRPSSASVTLGNGHLATS